MCTIYSVAKISDLKNITFNFIINAYAKLFCFKEHVQAIYTECVTNQDSGEKKDIIKFYNDVYLKQMKKYILLYRDQAREVRQELDARKRKAVTPGADQSKNQILSAVLTP